MTNYNEGLFKSMVETVTKVQKRLFAESDKEAEEFTKAWGGVKFTPSRVHEKDVAGSIVLHDTYGYTTVSLDELRSSDLDRCLYSEPSEEYIHTIKFMEQIRNDIESMFSYNCLPGGKSLGYEPDKVTAMGAGTGGWPTNSNDWAKVYQKAFPEPSEGQQTPIQQDPKDMAVKAETEEDRERLWQAVMDYGKGG